MKDSKYYIYFHVDPRDGFPRYIGKGSGNRAWQLGKNYRSKKHINWVNKLKSEGLEPIVNIGNRFSSEKECFDAEKLDIAFFRKIGVNLKNIADGGKGLGLNKEIIEKRAKKFCKPIICLSNGKTYNSTVECGKELNIDTRRINDILKGRKRSYKGYSFRYLKDDLNRKPNQIRIKKNYFKKYTTGKAVFRKEDGKKFNTFKELANELGLSSAYISKKFKNKDIVIIKEYTYLRSFDAN